MKQDLVTLAQMDACEKLNTLPAHEKEALYGTFPRTPVAFSNLLAFWLLQLSEMNQANFVGENTNEPNSLYKEMIQDIPLVVLSTTPCTHVLVYRGRNTWDRRLQDTNFGCSFVSKYHYFLTGAVKRFVLVHLSALCRTSDTDKAFLDYQMHPSTFRDRMETAREILFNHLLSQGGPQIPVEQLEQFRHHLQQISESASAASAASPVARAHSPGLCRSDCPLPPHHYSHMLPLAQRAKVPLLPPSTGRHTQAQAPPGPPPPPHPLVSRGPGEDPVFSLAGPV